MTAADEHGLMSGSALSEDTTEETAGETLDESDVDESPPMWSDEKRPTPDGKSYSGDPEWASGSDEETPNDAKGEVEMSVGSTSESKCDPFCKGDAPMLYDTCPMA